MTKREPKTEEKESIIYTHVIDEVHVIMLKLKILPGLCSVTNEQHLVFSAATPNVVQKNKSVCPHLSVTVLDVLSVTVCLVLKTT